MGGQFFRHLPVHLLVSCGSHVHAVCVDLPKWIKRFAPHYWSMGLQGICSSMSLSWESMLCNDWIENYASGEVCKNDLGSSNDANPQANQQLQSADINTPSSAQLV